MAGAVRSASLLAAVALAAGPAAAQPHRAAHPSPDFTGLWSTASLTELERPDEFKTLVIPEPQAQAFEKAHRGKPPDLGEKDNPVGGPESEWWELDVPLARIRGQVRTSWIVSPADGQRPFTPQARAANKAHGAGRLVDLDGPESRGPDERCLGIGGAGPPLENGGSNDNYQFVQTPGGLAIQAEWMHDVRTVRVVSGKDAAAARRLPPGVRIPNGDSVAHWDGDTLVIETTNFPLLQVNAPNHDPAADMRVVERLTRLSPTELLYAFSVTNSARYTQTWQAEMLLHAAKGPIYEFACHEATMAWPTCWPARGGLEGRTIDGVAKGR